LDQALAVPESHLRLFGKPECRGHRRLAVAVASADTLVEARTRAHQVAAAVSITLR
jgi:phosphoribosylglycinamide formyltransferase 2